MKPRKSIHPRARLTSMGYALRGLCMLVRREPNARIHLLATAGVIALGIARHISRQDWALIAVAIALVWMAEAFNTAIELLCDMRTRAYHPRIRVIKDMAAGAVLVASAASVAIAACVFLA